MSRSLRWQSRVWSLVVVCVFLASSGVEGASERALAARKQTVVLFPIANMLGPDKAEMADDLFILVKEGLTATGKFAVLAYDPKNVCVQRAVTEQHIT